jgi:hypothetical protein
MTRWLETAALVASLALAGGAGTAAAAQGSLAEAAERTRQAWLGHDAEAIVGQSAGIVFQIPGADPSAPVERSQAVELLRRHLRAAVERALTVSALREVEPGRGYAELERRYVVAGTTDVRRETIFLGFQKVGAAWLLTELRSAP